MGLIASMATAGVQIAQGAGKVASSVANTSVTMVDAVGKAAKACNRLADSAMVAADDYSKRVEAIYAPKDPYIVKMRELHNRLTAVAKSCYQHLSFLNDENSGPVLEGAVVALRKLREEQGLEPKPEDWYIEFLVRKHLDDTPNRIIKFAYVKYVEHYGKSTVEDTTSEESTPEMFEDDFDMSWSGKSSYEGYEPATGSEASPYREPVVPGYHAGKLDSSSVTGYSFPANDNQEDSSDESDSSNNEETGSAGSESSSDNNQDQQ